MAKKVVTQVKLQIKAGLANPAPPVLTQRVGAACAAMTEHVRAPAALMRLIHFARFMAILL